MMTDQNQAVAWQASYDPFGQATLTTESITNNLRFPGQYYDAETGLHYNYFRYYDPSTGRYFTSDPIGLDGGINTYLYANANPIKYIDPTGEAAAAGAVVVGGGVIIVGGCIATNCTKPLSDAIGNAVDAIGEMCRDEDDGNFCYNRWKQEDTRCWQWKELGMRVVKACQTRAADRRNLCNGNGGRPDPSEPPEYNPFVDYPR